MKNKIIRIHQHMTQITVVRAPDKINGMPTQRHHYQTTQSSRDRLHALMVHYNSNGSTLRAA